ncbi:MAG: dynamin family protein [Eubacteriales bacterium]|nr:dynamin family protein [Eubacteriales bacterium]
MKNYEEINQKIQHMIQQIEPYATEDTLFDIQQINKNFSMKIEDFYREGRKLNIGVIGRVKAGKSSFLNTLLFHGEEVLPKAATPKTAALTKMEYSDQNRVVIEFYSMEEWDGIEEDAKLGDKNEVTKSARELVEMARSRAIAVSEILQRGNLDKTFEEYTELLQFLNDYVGENGAYTPLVKSVVIYMNREEFKDISIVDTPGLNDPIPSRTLRTKEFIEVCDVVFFLSRAGSFLDMNDWELLCKQLPQKGVKKMVLVASQYDSGLRDVLKKEEKSSIFKNKPGWMSQEKSASKADNLPDAKKIVEESLGRRVKEKIASFKEQTYTAGHEMILKILKECEKPLLVSSRAQDMALKEYEDYSTEERADYKYWKGFLSPEHMKEEFLAIGNFDEVQAVYAAIKEEKQRLLEEKQREFIPKVYEELRNYFSDLQRQTEFYIECLQANDKDSLEEKQRFFESKINAIKADVMEVFGDTIEKIKLQKLDVNRTLRDMSIDAAKLEMHTGTETHHGSSTTYKFNFGPIHLGAQTEHYTYTTTYTYLAASDALEQITAYGKGAASAIEEVFRQTVELKAYRRKLLETVIRNFDAADQDFDANYFRIIVQNALNVIEFPEVHINVDRELEEIGKQFSGEIKNSADQDRFRNLLSNTVEKLYASMITKVDETISGFQSGMMSVQATLCDDILEKVSKEFESIKAAVADKKTEIEKNSKYLSVIKSIQNEL